MFECIIIQCASETSYDSFLNLKSYWNEKFHAKESLYIFLYNVNEMSEFYKSVKLWRFVKKIISKVMYNTWHYLVIAGS